MEDKDRRPRSWYLVVHYQCVCSSGYDGRVGGCVDSAAGAGAADGQQATRDLQPLPQALSGLVFCRL